MPASAQQQEQILNWLKESQGDMLALLEQLVNIDSGSYNKEGVDKVGEAVQAFLDEHGVGTSRIHVESHGDSFRGMVARTGSNRPIMLLGHRDTVFPDGEAERRPFKIEGNRAYGPGVADMKAGVVMNAFVLAAFQKFGGAPGPLVGLFTGDEEIGSPTSRPIIENEARGARVVFNSEPGRPTGNVVVERKGGIFFEVEITGVAAHSGSAHDKGRSAIGELAHKIQGWHHLTDYDSGITVNVGLISGGQSVNTVAPYASCGIDLRYRQLADRAGIVARIMAIANNNTVPETNAEIRIKGEFAPLAPTEASDTLFKHYVASASQAGLAVEGETSGGCADSGFTAGVGTPTVCATGPVGGNAHSPEEYLEVDSVVPRAQALARAIMTADQLDLPG